jgi:predicted HD superfamily hydrolase involved in NAD metabolism
MNEQEIQQRVREELSSARFEHTKGVVATVTELAQVYGIDPLPARLAGWIHDVAREWPLERLQQYAERVEIPSGFALIPALLHGPIGAALASEWFNINDVDVANAIRYHTTGRIGMSDLEMILCLSDAIEPSRNYPGVEEIRSLAKQNLKHALAKSFDSTIQYLILHQQQIFPLTVMARNDLWEHLRMYPSGDMA